MMRKSISCMLGGLLMSAPVWLFMGMGWDWLPGRPGLVMASAGTLLIVGGLWLWDEIREMLAEAATRPACTISTCAS
jgi:hypothetical protein